MPNQTQQKPKQESRPQDLKQGQQQQSQRPQDKTSTPASSGSQGSFNSGSGTR